MHICVHRAYFYAKAGRKANVELPEGYHMRDGDQAEGEPRKSARRTCGLLRKATYGTRDAAMAWQEEYEQTMLFEGLQAGRASPCHFCHRAHRVRIVVPGDNVLGLTRRRDADQLVAIMWARYPTEVQWMGRREDDLKAVRVLNRMIRRERSTMGAS